MSSGCLLADAECFAADSDAAQDLYGCKHYRRRCMVRVCVLITISCSHLLTALPTSLTTLQVKAPCCGEFFTCHNCHDEAMIESNACSVEMKGSSAENMGRYAVARVKASLNSTLPCRIPARLRADLWLGTPVQGVQARAGREQHLSRVRDSICNLLLRPVQAVCHTIGGRNLPLRQVHHMQSRQRSVCTDIQNCQLLALACTSRTMHAEKGRDARSPLIARKGREGHAL